MSPSVFSVHSHRRSTAYICLTSYLPSVVVMHGTSIHSEHSKDFYVVYYLHCLLKDTATKEKEDFLMQYKKIETQLVKLSGNHAKKMAELEKEIQILKVNILP